MTLQEIADYCCAKIGITDNATQKQAKTFAKHRWQMVWNRANWRQARIQQRMTVQAGVQDITLDSAIDYPIAMRLDGAIELLVTSDLTMLRNFPMGLDNIGQVTGFDPLPKDYNQNARVRLYQVPHKNCEVLVIGKAKCPALVADTDSPSIPGIEETLCAFVQGDLMQWLRQYSKAQVHFEEGTRHFENMLNIEREMSACDLRIIPIVEPSYTDNGTWLQK